MRSATRRRLIVNADDFGQGPGVNRGVMAAHEGGIVTSASLMVRWPAAAEASAYGRDHPGLSLGLHLDLGEWICRDGGWAPLYEVVSLGDAEAISKEVAAQLAAFRLLTGGDPTHIDSHQHVHLREPVRTVVLEAAERLGVPVRRCTGGVAYCGAFYGQTADGQPLPEAISVDALLATLAALPEGVSELACHPGEGPIEQTMYARERAEEVKALCDPRVRAALTAWGVELCSFRHFPGATAPGVCHASA